MEDNKRYYHSVRLQVDKCTGCTTCLRKCPTEAIRIRDEKAYIIKERCIDCGECIRTCPHHAKIARTDSPDTIYAFKHRIALPAPALYGQFKGLRNTDKLLGALLSLGFDYVFEVARGADMIARETEKKLKEPGCPQPLISSACPAIVRMIQVRFPELLDNLVDLKSPMEAAAIMARQEYIAMTGAKDEEIGVFFITPCPAKLTAIRNPIGHKTSVIQGAISVMDLYGVLAGELKHLVSSTFLHQATDKGVGWARTGGEIISIGVDNALAVDGIENVARVLEEIENNKLSDLDFFEGLSCIGGCVGGPLTFENSYVAKNRMRRIVNHMKQRNIDVKPLPPPENLPLALDEAILPRNVMKLDDDLKEALRKMEAMEEIEKRLPGLDCGSCGSPTCRALAEDAVLGKARELDCVILMKQRISEMANQMAELSNMKRIWLE